MAEDQRKKDDDFRFEIVEKIGILSTNQKGWSKELNFVSWNGRKSKYDIREWSPDHLKMSRGITMSESEFLRLTEIISDQAYKKKLDEGSNLYEIEEEKQEEMEAVSA